MLATLRGVALERSKPGGSGFAYAPQAYAGAVLTICSVSPRTVPSNAQCSRAARKS